MEKSNLTQLVMQAHTTAVSVYGETGKKVAAARAGRNVLVSEHLTVRRALIARVACRLLLKTAGIENCDVSNLMTVAAEHLKLNYEKFSIAETAFNGYLMQSWGGSWGAYSDPRIAGFSVKAEDSDNWTSATDKEGIISLMTSLGREEWLRKGFWEALRYLLAKHPGSEALQASEFFAPKKLGYLLGTEGKLAWWASYAEAAAERLTRQQERVVKMQAEHDVSACNTHYLAEAEEELLRIQRNAEKAAEAVLLLGNKEVQALIENIGQLYTLTGRERPEIKLYSKEELVEKQLASMEAAAVDMVSNLEKMLAALDAQSE